MAIPNYELYGESEASPIPDILHCESISERSRVHEGVIKPHRHDGLTQILFTHRGHIAAQLEDEHYDLDGRFLIVTPPLTVHGFTISADTDGWVLTLPHAGLCDILAPAPQVLDAMRRTLVFADGQTDLPFAHIETLFAHIQDEFAAARPARQFVLHAAIGQLAALIARADGALHGPGPSRGGRSVRVFARYRDLIEERFRQHDSIQAYAKALGLTTAHLGRICREVAGKSALQVLHERIVIEAKRNLVYSTMTVGEVAAVLGFDDPAYFTRFFTRAVGRPPAHYRQAAHSELAQDEPAHDLTTRGLDA